VGDDVKPPLPRLPEVVDEELAREVRLVAREV